MRQDSYDRHHSIVLVPEDVTVIDEVADIRSTEIHPNLYARVGTRAAPERHLVHIEELPLIR
jgi:hypothetical protein